MRRMFSLKQLEEISKKVIESGLVDNAKPIYYHPIYITDNTSEVNKRLSFVIIDNQDTPYTFDTFKAKIKALMDEGAFIQVNGYFMASSVCYDAYMCQKSGGVYALYGNDYQGTREGIAIDDVIASTFDDGVNKIN